MIKLKYIDLFAGAGGLSLGLYKAGLEGIFAIEKNPDAFSTLKSNLIDNIDHFKWPNWLPQTNHDINDVLSKYKNELLSLRGTVDLIVGGPPCQGFSMAGKRDHTDLRNKLIHSYLGMVELIEPNYVFFENVMGFKIRFREDNVSIPYSEIVTNELTKMGYIVEPYTLIMSDFGVPQRRKRIVLVASKYKDFSNEFLTRLLNVKNEFLQSLGLIEQTTVEESIDDLKKSWGVIISQNPSSKFEWGLYGKAQTNYQKLMRKGAPNLPNSHRFANHTQSIIDLHLEIQNKAKPGRRISPKDNLITGLKRRGVTLLDRNGVSPTITSIPDELVHYEEPRILTPREMARIQSFPDWFEFKGKYTSGGNLRKTDVPRYTQIGNAVPPLFAEQAGLVFNKYAVRIEGVDNEL